MNIGLCMSLRGLAACTLLAAFVVGPSSASAQAKAPVNMEYVIEWAATQGSHKRVNDLASKGWRLRNASMVQCPMPRDPSKSRPCVMIVMEREAG